MADVAAKQNAYQMRDPGTSSHQAGVNCVSLIRVSSAVTDAGWGWGGGGDFPKGLFSVMFLKWNSRWSGVLLHSRHHFTGERRNTDICLAHKYNFRNHRSREDVARADLRGTSDPRLVEFPVDCHRNAEIPSGEKNKDFSGNLTKLNLLVVCTEFAASHCN